MRHKLGDGEAYTLISRAVYLISTGTNDYYAPLTKNFSLVQDEEYVGMVIGNLTNVIKVICTTFSIIYGTCNVLLMINTERKFA